MSRIKTFNALAGLIFGLVLSACHPSAKDKQDVHDGMNYAAIHLAGMGPLSKTYRDFLSSDESSSRSKYFKTGADYLVMKMTYQEHRAIMFSHLGDFNERIIMAPTYASPQLDLATVFVTSRASLQQDLAAIAMTPESFGQFVSDSTLPKIMAAKLDPNDF